MRLSNKGFSILEILIAVAIFMVGMLGVAMLQISSMKNNAYSGNMGEAMSLASAKLEELMPLSFDHPDLVDVDSNGEAATQDLTGPGGIRNGIDDDDDGAPIPGVDGIGNFGLDSDLANRDQPTTALVDSVGTNNKYQIYWNIADNVMMPNTKTIKVFVVWSVKGSIRRIGLQTTIYRTATDSS